MLCGFLSLQMEEYRRKKQTPAQTGALVSPYVKFQRYSTTTTLILPSSMGRHHEALITVGYTFSGADLLTLLNVLRKYDSGANPDGTKGEAKEAKLDERNGPVTLNQDQIEELDFLTCRAIRDIKQHFEVTIMSPNPSYDSDETELAISFIGTYGRGYGVDVWGKDGENF
jgi:hypothetical protein